MSVVQRHTTRRIAAPIIGAAYKSVTCGIVVGKSLVASTAVAPRVAVKAERKLAPSGVEAMLQPGTRITSYSETVAVVHRVMVAQVTSRRQIFHILEVYVTMVAPPIGVHAEPCRQIGLVRNIPVKVQPCISTDIVCICLMLPALVAAGVAVVVE